MVLQDCFTILSQDCFTILSQDYQAGLAKTENLCGEVWDPGQWQAKHGFPIYHPNGA